MSMKRKVPQAYSPADENAGLAYAFRDDDIIKLENTKLTHYR
jgi:hypothetical protein